MRVHYRWRRLCCCRVFDEITSLEKNVFIPPSLKSSYPENDNDRRLNVEMSHLLFLYKFFSLFFALIIFFPRNRTGSIIVIIIMHTVLQSLLPLPLSKPIRFYFFFVFMISSLVVRRSLRYYACDSYRLVSIIHFECVYYIIFFSIMSRYANAYNVLAEQLIQNKTEIEYASVFFFSIFRFYFCGMTRLRLAIWCF